MTSNFFLLFNLDTPKTKVIKIIQRRRVSIFGPALIAVLGSHDCCNSTDSNVIAVFICALRPTPALPGMTARAVICNLMSSVAHSTTKQLKDLFPCIHYHRS